MDFGRSLDEVALRFSKQMDEFEAEGGATNNRFYGLGVHVYHSVARSIELVLREQPYSIDVVVRQELIGSISQLRQLAATDFRSYSPNPLAFWTQGRKISKNISSAAESNRRSSRVHGSRLA